MLEEVKQIFNDIRDAIIEMGVDVDYCDSPAEYASKILSISGGGSRSLLFVPVFKSSETKPEKPTDTMSASNPTNYPSGWGTPNGLSTPIWMSYTIVGTNITYVPWTEPVCISGGNTGDGSTDSTSDLRYRLFTVYGYASTEVTDPGIPKGGTWNTTSEKLTGLVSSSASNGSTITWLTEYSSDLANTYNVWISSAVFASNGNLCGSWAVPFKISPYSGSGTGTETGASIFTSFAFTTMKDDTDLSTYTVEGGTYDKPIPTTTKNASGNVVSTITWTDGPDLTTGMVWMVSAVFSNKNGSTIVKNWSNPRPLIDTADIEIIYTALANYKTIPDNFKKGDDGITIDSTWEKSANNNGWYDDASQCKNESNVATPPVYMAVNKMLHNKWQGWQIMQIKGEKGDKGESGTSINVKGTYDSLDALNAAVENGTIKPAVGDAYIIKGELYVWNGDSEGGSFINCGTFHGGSYLYVAYSNDGGSNFTATLNGVVGATVGKYIGICVTDSGTRPESVSAYTWSKWQGTDGFGYEAVFALTSEYTKPDKPAKSDKDGYTDDVWKDDHEDVSASKPYCWYCWRKKTPNESGVAEWGDWKGPYIFVQWSKEALSLSLDQDALTVYYVDDVNVSGDQTVTVSLYTGSAEITGSATYELADYNGCDNKGVTINGNLITVKDINATGSVTVKAIYNDMIFTKILRLKKNVNETGYELKLTKDFVSYNTSTSEFAPSSVTITVCKDTPSLEGITHEIVGSTGDLRMEFASEGKTTSTYVTEWETTGHVFTFTDASDLPCTITLTKKNASGEYEYQDDETIDIFKYKDGSGSGSGETGDSYIPVSLYQATDSYSEAPTVATTQTTYSTTSGISNPPSGWSTSTTTTDAKPYLWEIDGHFSKKTGEQVGSWYGPFLKTGIPGPIGASGDEKEEVYSWYTDTSVPTIGYYKDSNNKTQANDGYLPTFIFNEMASNGTKEATEERPSVSSSQPYVWGTYRRKHGGVWSDFFSPYLVANYVSAGLTDEEKDQIKTDVTNSLTSELGSASARVSAVESRLENIDGTNATFFTDKQEALISAITSYKDDKQNSFADLIISGQETKITAIAGSETDDKLKTAGVIADGEDGTVNLFADYKDKTNKMGSALSSVGIDIDAEASTLEQYAVNKTAEKISSVQTQLDAANATWKNSVAKSYYFWAKYTVTSNGVKEISKKADYDLSDVGEGKNYATEEDYVKAMTTGEDPWQKVTVIEALSNITQEAGAIKIAASEGESWASIVVKANEATGSDITLNADRINFNGETTATQATITKATIEKATITEGTISKATITDCTIESTLQSKDYSGDVGSKKGFLFDATTENGDFAIYALPENGEPTLRLAAATDSNGKTSYDVAIPGAVINDLTSNNIKFVDSNGKGAAAVTVNNVEYTEGSFGAMLNLSSPAIQLTSGQITFTNNDTGEEYASFSEAVSTITNKLIVDGNLTAGSLQTPVTETNPSTYISNGTCRFIQPGYSNADIEEGADISYVEIGWDSSGKKNMVLKFFHEGKCMYNLGPAGFKKV